MPALPAAIVTALLAVQTPLHTFHGDSAGDEFGVAAAFAGDANGDGYADILVGAHWDDNFGTDSGSARLFSGRDGSVLTTLYGDAAGDFFGLSVVGIGASGLFAVGADGSDLNGIDSGLVRIFSGSTGAIVWDIPGFAAGEKFGTTLADVGDPARTLLVGVPSTNFARVVSTLTGATVWSYVGSSPGDQFGSAVASGRDLTGDGVPDYVVGAPGDDIGGVDSGSVSVFSGANGSLVRTLRGWGPGDRFGSSIAVLNDCDGDGRAEIIVGAPRSDAAGSDSGSVYLYSGLSGSLILTRVGDVPGDQFGGSTAGISTTYGNAEPAFVVGARFSDVTGNNAGSAYVYSALTGLRIQALHGRAPGDWFGGVVAGGKDVDGNGVGDFLSTSRLADVNGGDSGSAEIYASPLLTNDWYVDASAPGPGTGTLADPYRSIQYAINRATTRSGDTLLVLPGIYHERIDLIGKSIGVVGTHTSMDTIIDAEFLGNCVKAVTAEARPARLQHLSLINGSGDSGGGVVCESELRIEDCIFDGNGASFGGAVSGVNSLIGCTLRNNISSYDGGAVAGAGDIIDCIFTGNYAYGFGGAVGGAALISGCTFRNNEALGAGGAIADASIIRDSTVDHNQSNYGGGGIYLTTDAVIENCYIGYNGAGIDDYRGGGIFVDDYYGPANVVVRSSTFERNGSAGGGGAFGGNYFDCKFVENRATSTVVWPYGSGGGLHSAYAERCIFLDNVAWGSKSYEGEGGGAHSSTLVQCTLVGNITSDKNGPIVGGGGAANCTVTNSILWANVPDQCFASMTVYFSDVEGGWPGVGNISSDPLFVNVAVADFHLTSLSPCIDAGDPNSPPDPDGSRADMGAYPYDPNYCPPPFSYCTAKTNSCGAVPAIGSAGTPSAGATTGFTISATGARTGKLGLLMYSPNGQWNSPFQGGTLCIAPQGLRRGPPVAATGGTGGLACDAVFQIDWAAFASGALGGTPPSYLRSVGQRVNVQWWGRDSNVTGSFLSDAIQYEVCP